MLLRWAYLTKVKCGQANASLSQFVRQFVVGKHINEANVESYQPKRLDYLRIEPLEPRLLLDADPTSGFGFNTTPAIEARHLFYNNSSFDGNDPGVSALDDAAIDSTRMALLPGETPQTTNVSSYTLGINGLMIDVVNLANSGNLSLNDFTFEVASAHDATAWVTAPDPDQIVVRPGEGTNGSDRITLTWPDGSITARWLRVTTRATAATGLASDDVFLFGNLPADASGNGLVNIGDLAVLALEFGSVGDEILLSDFNRDGIVNIGDLSVLAPKFGSTYDQIDTQPPDIELRSFSLPDVGTVDLLDIDPLAVVGPDGLIGQAVDFDVDLHGLFEGISATDIVTRIDLFDEDGDRSTAEGFKLVGDSLSLPSYTFNIGGQSLLEVTNLQIDLEELTFRNGIIGGSLNVFFDQANLMPGVDAGFTGSLELGGGSLNLDTGALSLSTLRFDMAVGDVIALAGAGAAVMLDPNDTASDAELLSVGNAVLSFPAYPDLPTVTMNGLTVRRNGFDLNDFEVDFGSEADASALASAAEALTSDAPNGTGSFTPARPVLLVPGIVGTFPKANDAGDEQGYINWLMNRGAHPDTMEGEQLTKVNDDLYQSFINKGYTPGVDLFVVAYDWRVLPGRIDGTTDASIDGVINGYVPEDIVDEIFETGVDYMGWYLDLASDMWALTREGNPRPQSVDVVAHSTGGLVTRSYIQSNVYNASYVDEDSGFETHTLPKINHFVSVGVPHRGASKAWGPLNNEFNVDPAFQIVLSKILLAPYEKLVNTNDNWDVIRGPSGDPNGDDAIHLTDILDSQGQPSIGKFIDLYLPTARALLATYDFLYDPNGNLVDVNADPSLRNRIAHDLNGGADLGQPNDPNAFLNLLDGRFTVVAGWSESTPTTVQEHIGKSLETVVGREQTYAINPNPASIAEIDAYLKRRALPGEKYLLPIAKEFGGDGTVPLASSIGQFLGDSRADIKLFVSSEYLADNNLPTAPAANVDVRVAFEAPGHLPLMYLTETQQDIFAALGMSAPTISRGEAIAGSFSNIKAILSVDPVGAVAYDQQGNPLVGYDPALGGAFAAPGTAYFGGADGLGVIYEQAMPDGETIDLQLKGLTGGSDYRVDFAQYNGGVGGGSYIGSLAEDQTSSEQPLFEQIFDGRYGIGDIVEVDGLSITGTNISVSFNQGSLSIDGILRLAADQAAILPDRSTEALDGMVTVTDFAGSIDLSTGALSMQAGTADLLIEDVIEAHAAGSNGQPGISLNYDPNNTDPTAELATLRGLTVALPGLPELPVDAIQINELVLRQTGFDLDVTVGGPGSDLDINIDGLVDVQDIEITVDVSIDLLPVEGQALPQLALGGAIEFAAQSATLLPGQPIELAALPVDGDTRPAVKGLLDFDSGQFGIELLTLEGALTVDGETWFSLTAGLGEDDASALTFNINRDLAADDLVFSLPNLTGTFDALGIDDGQGGSDAPEAVMNGFAVQRDGGVELSSIGLTLPNGYLNKSLGLGGFLPVELSQLIATFDELSDGSADFGSLMIDVTGIVDTAGLENTLGDLLAQPPVLNVQKYDAAGNLTNLANGGQISFSLLVENGQPKLVDVPGLHLGVTDFVLSLPAGETINLDGSLTLPAIDGNGVVQEISAALIPDPLSSVTPTPQAILNLAALADTQAGVLGGSFVVGGAVTPQVGGGFLLSLDGQVTIEGDLSFLGGSASGTTTASFLWDLSATPQPDGTLALAGLPELQGVLFEQVVLEVDGIARLIVPEASIDFSAPPGDAVATADNVTLQLLMPGLEGISGNVASVALFDDLGSDGIIDGFSFTGLSLNSLGTLGIGPAIGSDPFDPALIELTNASLTLPELTYRSGALIAGLPDMTLNAAGIALNLPGVTASASGLNLIFDLNAGLFELAVTSLTLGVGEKFDGGGSLFNVELINPVLRVDEDDATDLLRVQQATLGFGVDAAPLDELEFTLNPTALNDNQAFRFNLVDDGQDGLLPQVGLGALALATTGNAGVLTSLGFSGLLPFDIDGVSLAFTATDVNGYTDLTQFDLNVQGLFDFSVFGDLPFEPSVSIGQTPLASGNGGGATDQGEGRFAFDVAFDFSGSGDFPVVPVFQDVRIGLAGLELGGFTYGGEVAIAGYRLDGGGAIVPLAYGVNASDEQVLVDLSADADPNEPGTQTGDQVIGELFVESGQGTTNNNNADFDFNGLRVLLAGALSPTAQGFELQLTGELDIDATVSFGEFLVLDSFGLTGSLLWAANNDLSNGQLELGIDQARTRGFSIGLGEFFQASATGSDNGPDGIPGNDDDGFLAFNFSDDPQVPLLVGLDLTLASPALGLFGSINGIDIDAGGLPPFDEIDSVSIGILEDSMLDTLQDWFLPIRTQEITVDFANDFFAYDSEDPPRIVGIADPLAVALLIEGAVGVPGFIGEELGEIGLDAEIAFQGLGIDLTGLRDLAEQLLTWAGELGGQTFDAFIDSSDQSAISAAFNAALNQAASQGLPFDIFALGSVIDISYLNGLGLELGFEFGDGMAVTGAISVGRADANEDTSSQVDDIYYLAIKGAVKVSGYGGGGTIVLTTAGPVAGTIEFAVPIPLGQTTLTLGGGGGIVFGKDLLEDIDTSQPTVNPADIPTPLDWDLTDLSTIEGILSGLWNDNTNQLDPVWTLPATLAINGKLSSLAVLGMISLEGTLAATLPALDQAVQGQGLSFLGVGDFKVLGLPFGTGGVLVDARDLLNPAFSFGMRVPPKDNPLGFLFPVQADLAGTLRTDGAIEAWLVGLRVLMEGAVNGTNGPMADLLAEIADRLEADRLAGVTNDLPVLLGLSPGTPITATNLRSAVINLINGLTGPSPSGALDAQSNDPWVQAALMADALWLEMQLVAERLEGFDFQAAVGDVLSGFLIGAATSADDAVREAWSAFNPSFVMRGAVQPSLFGFDMGEPTDEVDLVINKNQITLDMTMSNLLAGAFAPFRALGITDRFEVGFTADLPGQLIDVLLDPNAPQQDILSAFGDALNPFTGWEGKLAGSLSLLGFDVGKVSGLIFGPQETDINGNPIGGTIFANNVYNFGLSDGVELNGSNTDLPSGSEDKVPVYYQSRYDNMIDYGGLLLTGELRIPDLLRDPIPIFESLANLTQTASGNLAGPWAGLTDPSLDLTDLSNLGALTDELMTYFEESIDLLTQESPVGTLQIYMPSPATLVDGFLDYTIPALVGGGDATGEAFLHDRVSGQDDQGNLLFAAATPWTDDGSTPPLLFADLNGNGFYDQQVDVLVIGPPDNRRAWSDRVESNGKGDLTYVNGQDVLVPASLLTGIPLFELGDVIEDEGNGFLDGAKHTNFDPALSLGFNDVNEDGMLNWSADPNTGAITFHEPLLNPTDGSLAGDLTSLPNLVVFLDQQAIAPGGSPDGYTPSSETTVADPLIGLNEGFNDINGNGRFDLDVDVLYDLNGNGLPDGELFIDADLDGQYTRPEPLDDINGNGVRDVTPSLTEPFTDLNGNDIFDTGDPFIDLGNALYDPPAEPVFSFDDTTQQAVDLFDAAYIDGFVDVTLLGLNLGNGRLRATTEGLFIDITSGLYGESYSLGMALNEFNVGEMIAELTDAPFAEIAGSGLLEALLPSGRQSQVDDFRQGLINLAGKFTFPIPVVALDAGFDLSMIRNWLDDSFGSNVSSLFMFTDSQGNPSPIDATVRAEFFSPLFDETPPVHPTADPSDPRYVDPPLLNDDLIQRYGGGRVSATLNLPGLVEGAVGLFESQFPNSPDDLFAADFAFLAKADKLVLPLLNDDILRADNLRLSMTKSTGAGNAIANINLSGSVGFMEGFGGGIAGDLSGNLTFNATQGSYGVLNLSLDTGTVNFGPDGDLSLGADADVRILVNSTGITRTLSFTQYIPSLNAFFTRQIDMPANSASVWIDGELTLGTTTLNGAFQLQANSTGVVVFGNATMTDSSLDLLLGNVANTGLNVTFAGGIQEAYETLLVLNKQTGQYELRSVLDGLKGAFVFDLNATTALGSAGVTLSMGFNTSSVDQDFDLSFDGVPAGTGLQPVSLPSNLQSMLSDLDANSVRVFANGNLNLTVLPADVSINGLFAAQLSLSGMSELDLYAEATLDLGDLGSVAAKGWLELGSGFTTAGYFDIQASAFGIYNVAQFSGSVELAFNSGRYADVPTFLQSYVGPINVGSGSFVEFQLDNARFDLFNTVALGGDGTIRFSDTSGFTATGAFGTQIKLPSFVRDEFDGMLPSTLSYGASLPSKLNPPTVNSSSFEFDIDLSGLGLGNIGSFTILGDRFGVDDMYGYVNFSRNMSGFGGLIGVNGDIDLRINTTSSSKYIIDRWISANNFRMAVSGDIEVDPIPSSSNDDEVMLDGSMVLLATPNQVSISGSAEMSVDILGLLLVELGANVDVTLEQGILTEARFYGSFTINGVTATGWAEVTPSGCLDLPGSLPDACDEIEVLLLGTTVTEGGSGQIEVRLTNPVPTSSTVEVDLFEASPHIQWSTTSNATRTVTFSAGQTVKYVSFNAPYESPTTEDFVDETVTITATRAFLDRPWPQFDSNLTGTLQTTVTVLDPDEATFIRVVEYREGVDPNGTASPTAAGFQFRLENENGQLVSLDHSLTVNYEVLQSLTTAVVGEDYLTPDGVLTIPAGWSVWNEFVDVINDDLLPGVGGVVEPDKTLTLEITGLSSNFVDTPNTGINWGTATIRDEDTAELSVEVTDSFAGEGNGKFGLPNNGTFEIRLSKPSSTDTRISYNNLNPFFFSAYPIAEAGKDFNSMLGEVVIPAGQTSVQITLSVRDDSADEGDEAAYLTIEDIVEGDSDITIRQVRLHPTLNFYGNDSKYIVIVDDER